MTYYDEIFNKVVSEGEKRLEKERRFKIRIKRMSAAISGICAVAIIGAVIYKGASPKQLTAPPTNSGIIVTENETKPVSEKTGTTKAVTTTAVTTGATNTNKTTTVQTQHTTKPQQTEISKIQTTAVTTTVIPPVQTTIIEETTDKSFELVDLGSGLIKPYHAPNNSAVNMPSVLLNGREVRHKNVNNCDDMEISFRVGTMDFGLERFVFMGNEYYSEYDEYSLDFYESGTDTKYQYDIDTDTVYSVDITYYRIPNYLGESCYAVKFPNSEQIYLYRFYCNLYYDNEKGEYLEVRDPNSFNKDTKYIDMTHEDEDFFKYFDYIKYGNKYIKLEGVYCNYSEIPDENFYGFYFFSNYVKDINQVYISENCMLYKFDEPEDAIVVRFGYDDVCYLYRIAE